MKIKYLLYVPIILSFFSCSKKEDKVSEKNRNGFVSKSLSTVKSSAGQLKDYVIEPDSIKQSRRFTYHKMMLLRYPEYSKILDFFKTKSPYVLETRGKIYRINDLKITDNGTIIHKYDEDPTEVKYFYDADKNYYVYTFNIENENNPVYSNVRRIRKGAMSQPVHDLLFENGRLIREDFVADVSKDFFDENGNQYFEIIKKIDGSKVKNLYNLGPVQNY